MTSLRHQHVGSAREHALAPQRGWVRRIPGVAVLILLLIVAAGGYVTRTAPRPAPAGVPAGDFSAERAFAHVERIAAVPHPAGSPANAAVRDYIIAELVELGLQPRVLAATTVRGNELAQVENIHARIPGRASTGHVVAAAHYDSAPQAPGAADDAAGVAAILETARALRAGPPVRNDVELVITDAEEPGLLGARAFVTAGVLDPARSVVVNLEAGGSSGPSLLFQTSPGNADLVRAFATAKNPAGGSELAALFDALPNDTDFTEFRDADFAGLNLIFGDGHVHYHSPTDTPANLDPASLQHQGDNLLTLTRVFGEQELPLRHGEDTTFFTVFDRLIWYPDGLVVPFALLALGGFAATLWYARRHGARLRGAAAAAATLPLMLAIVGGLGVAAWWVLGRLRPEYRALDWGATYRPEWYEAGLTVLAIAMAVSWYFTVRRRMTSLETTLGLLTWLAGFAIALAIVEPATAYLFTWPALAGCAGLAVGLRLTHRDPAWPAVGGAAAALPAAALWQPDYSLGLAWAAGPMTMVALLTATAMPAADQLRPRRSFTVPTIGIVTAVVLITVGYRVDVLDAKHPAQTSLAYALDADHGTATWLSADPVLSPWTKQYVTEQTTDIGDTFPGPLGRARHSGPAPTWPIQPPEVTVTDARQDDDRRVIRLRITPEGARRVDVAAATAGRRITATVQGLPVDGEPPKPPTRAWDWTFTFEPIPPNGIDLTLTVEGNRPLPIRVLAYHDGLPPLPQFTPPPEDLTWSRRLPHATIVATTHHV
jgi:Peptidase family M28